jgi:hypothetical protein
VASLHNPDGKPFEAGSDWTVLAEPRQGDLQTIRYIEGKESEKHDVVDRWRWMSDRREILSRGSSTHQTCVWAPPLLDLRLPARSGASWSGTTGCTTDAGNNGRETRKYRVSYGAPFTTEVKGHGRQLIWPVHSVMDIDFRSNDFSARMVVTLDVQLLPGMVIPLRMIHRQDTYQGGVKTSSETKTRDLKQG